MSNCALRVFLTPISMLSKSMKTAILSRVSAKTLVLLPKLHYPPKRLLDDPDAPNLDSGDRRSPDPRRAPSRRYGGHGVSLNVPRCEEIIRFGLCDSGAGPLSDSANL